MRLEIKTTRTLIQGVNNVVASNPARHPQERGRLDARRPHRQGVRRFGLLSHQGTWRFKFIFGSR